MHLCGARAGEFRVIHALVDDHRRARLVGERGDDDVYNALERGGRN